MKKILVILVLGLLFACQKEEIQKPIDMLTIQLKACSVLPETIQINPIISRDVVLFSDEFSISTNDCVNCYEKTFGIEQNKPITLTVNHSELKSSAIALTVKVNGKSKAIKLIKEQNTFIIRLNNELLILE